MNVFRFIVPAALVLASTSGFASVQRMAMDAARSCDAETVTMALSHERARLTDFRPLRLAITASFDTATEVRMQSCFETVGAILEVATSSDELARLYADEALDALASSAAPMSGHADADRRRREAPLNSTVRAFRLIEALKDNGVDHEAYISRPPRDRFDRATEPRRLLDRVVSSGAYRAALTAHATGQNPHTGAYQFLSQYIETVDVNAKNPQGKTALMFAAEGAKARSSADAMVAFLLEAGADPRIKDSQGRTAADYAMEAGDVDAHRLLRD